MPAAGCRMSDTGCRKRGGAGMIIDCPLRRGVENGFYLCSPILYPSSLLLLRYTSAVVFTHFNHDARYTRP